MVDIKQMTEQTHIWIARLFLVGLAVFAVYYPFKFITTAWPFAFAGPESWAAYWFVEDDVLVPFAARAGQFFMWLPTVLATQAMILTAMWLVILLLRGIYFEARTVRALQWVGALAAFAGATSLIAQAFNPWLLTLYNTDKHLPIRFFFDSGEIGVLLVGLGLFLLGRVLHVTVVLSRENKEFV